MEKVPERKCNKIIWRRGVGLVVGVIAFGAVMVGLILPAQRLLAKSMPPQIVLTVIPFKISSGSQRSSWMGYGLAQILSTKLDNIAALQVVDGWQILDELKGSNLKLLDLNNPEIAQEVTRPLGVKYVVLGRFSELDENKDFRVEAQVLSLETSKFKELEPLTAPYANLMELEATLALKVAQIWGAEVTKTEKEKIAHKPTKSLVAYQWFSNGLEGYEVAPSEAISAWKKAIEIDPEFLRPYYNLAVAHLKANQLEDATHMLKKLLELKPDYAPAHNVLGVIYRLKGLFEDSVDEFKKALALKPHYALALLNLGLTYFEKQNYYDAIAEYKKTLRLNPDSAIAHHWLGLAYDKNQQFYKAMAEYKKALKLKPDYAKVHHDLGFLYGELGMMEEEIAEYNRALPLYKPHENLAKAQTHLNLGITYGDIGRYDEAIAQFEAAVKHRPDWAAAYFDMGVAYTFKKDYDQGIIYYKKALKSYRKKGDELSIIGAHSGLGNAYLKKYCMHDGDGETLDEAIAEFKTALKLIENLQQTPQYELAYAHRELGCAYWYKGQMDDAIAHSKRALEIEPSLYRAHATLGYAYESKGMKKEAIKYFKKYIEIESIRYDPDMKAYLQDAEEHLKRLEAELAGGEGG